MITCPSCKKEPASRTIGVCADCLRSLSPDRIRLTSHIQVRSKLGLPPVPPQNQSGTRCKLCSNECRIHGGERGYCGLRENAGGKIRSVLPPRSALAHMYPDPLPTNCCAAWFCRGSEKSGYNLAVFFYGCNFDCLFCQNASHKNLQKASFLSEDDLVRAALSPDVRCVCFFGGSPEPQLPFALRVARRIMRESGNTKHICWEWNGCGHPALVKKAADFSARSGGTVKFDLKAFHPNTSLALCGVDVSRAYENFSLLAGIHQEKGVLTATTLLVSYYVEGREVEGIARFISRAGRNIPYSLLVFHPDFLMDDLPVTPKSQVEECLGEARSHLSDVNLGNSHLL